MSSVGTYKQRDTVNAAVTEQHAPKDMSTECKMRAGSKYGDLNQDNSYQGCGIQYRSVVCYSLTGQQPVSKYIILDEQ